MTPTLELRRIDKSFNGLEVLKDASFTLESGTISTLFGQNGSGKTTLINIICGFLKSDKGEVILNEQIITGKSPSEISRLGIGLVWQKPRICKNLSVEDNIILASKDHPGEKLVNYIIRPIQIIKEEKKRKRRAKEISEELKLGNLLNEKAGALSAGQQKLISVAMLLMNDAEMLIFDEPFSSISTVMIDRLCQVLTDLKLKGKTVLMIEHNRAKALTISDKVFTLENGFIDKIIKN